MAQSLNEEKIAHNEEIMKNARGYVREFRANQLIQDMHKQNTKLKEEKTKLKEKVQGLISILEEEKERLTEEVVRYERDHQRRSEQTK